MSTANPTLTLAYALERLGNVPAERIRMSPAPGTATPDDVEVIRAREKRLFELVDGFLVEKPMGFRESLVAMLIARILADFVDAHHLGLVVGADGIMRLFDDIVRIPDVAFVSWDRLPDGRVPEAPAPRLAPTIAVEVLSQSNTAAEMARKRSEYSQAGVLRVWEVDIHSRTVAVYAGEELREVLDAHDTLRCDVLPGFELGLANVFAVLDRKQP